MFYLSEKWVHAKLKEKPQALNHLRLAPQSGQLLVSQDEEQNGEESLQGYDLEQEREIEPVAGIAWKLSYNSMSEVQFPSMLFLHTY